MGWSAYAITMNWQPSQPAAVSQTQKRTVRSNRFISANQSVLFCLQYGDGGKEARTAAPLPHDKRTAAARLLALVFMSSVLANLCQMSTSAFRLFTSLLHLSLFLTPARPVGRDPAAAPPRRRRSRKRPLRLTSAGVRPCDSSHRSKS